MMSAETTRIKPPEGSGWHMHSPYGAQRYKDGPDGYVVRLADVVRWLMEARETSFAKAVRAVCAPLESDAPPLLYRLDAVDDAAPENDTTEWLRYLSGYEGLQSLPPQVANARAAALALKAAWLMTPRELSRLVNSPGFPREYDETKESPFEFSERTDRTGGPKDLAVPFAVAHALWGWGTVVKEAATAAIPLANWPDLMAYRKANRGKDWGVGNQLDIARAELGERTAKGRATESDALEAMAMELGMSGREALRKVIKMPESDRKRVSKAKPAAAVTVVRDGRKMVNGGA